VTLISKKGHFSVNPPSSYNIGDLPLGRETATFQIKGISEGFDSLLITARGDNTQHLIYDFSFSDSYSSSITVGHPPPTPTQAPTPTPAPTPSPTSKPTTPAHTPSSTPAPTLSPDETSTPASISQLSIRLTAPLDGEQWVAGTMRDIKWDTNGGADPLTVSLEYSTVGTDGPWVAIATDMPSNGSVMWKTPNVTSTIYIRAFITDSADPPETASTLSSVEITAANAEFPLILIPAMLIPAIAILTVLFKRKGNNASAFSKAPVKSERLKLFLKGH
jgi:hypothetical protein